MLPWGFDLAFDAAVSKPGTLLEEVLRTLRPRPEDGAELDRSIADAIERSRELPGRTKETLLRWAMGEVMPAVAGRVDPRTIRERLERGLPGRDGGAA